MPMMRVNGVMKALSVRKGVDKNGRPYTIREARILVADLDFVNVTLGDDDLPPAEGGMVDWLVNVTTKGGYLSIRREDDFPVGAARPVKAAS